jgi:hypothetical protein
MLEYGGRRVPADSEAQDDVTDVVAGANAKLGPVRDAAGDGDVDTKRETYPLRLKRRLRFPPGPRS